jgi:hypothetical protein
MQDDSELLENALTEQGRHGRLVLRRRVWISGIAHEPATYILKHVGPVPDGLVIESDAVKRLVPEK